MGLGPGGAGSSGGQANDGGAGPGGMGDGGMGGMGMGPDLDNAFGNVGPGGYSPTSPFGINPNISNEEWNKMMRKIAPTSTPMERVKASISRNFSQLTDPKVSLPMKVINTLVPGSGLMAGLTAALGGIGSGLGWGGDGPSVGGPDAGPGADLTPEQLGLMGNYFTPKTAQATKQNLGINKDIYEGLPYEAALAYILGEGVLS